MEVFHAPKGYTCYPSGGLSPALVASRQPLAVAAMNREKREGGRTPVRNNQQAATLKRGWYLFN